MGQRRRLEMTVLPYCDFLSTSRSLDVATEPGFLGEQGVLLQISPGDADCADVSWISKFPEEKEVLISPCKLKIGQVSCHTLPQYEDVYDAVLVDCIAHHINSPECP